jgi:hypothetical protein
MVEINEAVRLEHRLTKMEEAVVANTDETRKLSLNVEKQNGRIGELETWRTQQGAIMMALVAAGPFVFWALGKWFGG